MLLKDLKEYDIIVCTALIAGKTPLSLDEELINSLKDGCVIVDLAAEKEGNSWITRTKGTGRVEYKTPDGKVIKNLGYLDWASHMPT